MQTGNAYTLPAPLQRRLEATLGGFMYPAGAAERDFLEPAGEPALIAHDSVSWRVFANPVTLFIGGVAAVLLELAEPRVRTGVWEHTSFRSDPMPRLRRTGYAAMMTVYGPRTRAEAMIARVGRLHDRVAGVTPDGQPYRATQAELLDWVQATASFGFLEAYHAYAQALDAGQRDRFYAEAGVSARFYGATGAPVSQQAQEVLFAQMRPRLAPSAIVTEFLGIMRHAPILPRPLAPVQGWLIDAAVRILPDWLRQTLGLSIAPHGFRQQFVAASAAAADRLLLRTHPAVLACRRLGLREDFLRRRWPEKE